MKRSTKLVLAASAVTAIVALNGVLVASCAQTPTNVPVQTFEQPKSVDFVCLQVAQPGIYPTYTPIIPAVPQPQTRCAPVPAGINGSELPYHLIGLVTQVTRGEVAVVDLTAGYNVDVDPSTPGLNFLPVGRLPSDIAATPDGTMVYVGSADPNAPSIFALPSTLILGGSQDYDGGEVDPQGTRPIPDLTTWPVCSLPQAPGAMRILSNDSLPASADGGAPSTSVAGYVIVTVFPGDSNHPAYVATIDPAPLIRGSAPYYDAGLPPGYQVDAGSLSPCTILKYVPLSAPAAGTTWSAGPTWDDGVKYVDASLDVDTPQAAVACSAPADAGASPTSTGGAPLPLNLGAAPSGGATVLDTAGARPTLYVADNSLPMIHVVDVSNPAAPTELAPLLATSLADPSRVVSVGQIAVSPPTREFKRFLYAIDRVEGDIMVYDVTDPVGGPKVPLQRPHASLNPFEPQDRILYGSPVASVAFVQHDWPLTAIVPSNGAAAVPLTVAQTGLLCNPNPNVVVNPKGVDPEQGPFSDNGAYYRNYISIWSQEQVGPFRLRGVFAFATLTNGSVMVIDVDDWDAPCRRPDPLGPLGTVAGPADLLVDGQFNAIAPPQRSSGPSDTGPYDVPLAWSSVYTDTPVTQEWFYPVSAPHRTRSAFWLTNNTVSGNHAPYLLGVPQLFASGSPLATQGVQAIANPSLVPTDTRFVDPSDTANPIVPDPSQRTPTFTPGDGGTTGGVGADASDITIVQTFPNATPGVRFQWEDPSVFVDQDWTVTFEGPLPGFFDNGGNPLIQTNVRPFNQDDNGHSTDDGGTGEAPDYSAAWLYNHDGYFCGKGIEDFAAGAQRADAENAAMTAAGLPPISNFDAQVGDYIQVWNPVRAPSDPYWSIDNACWAEGPSKPADRASLCMNTYGLAPVPTVQGGQTTPITQLSLQRDFPIIEAYDGKLLIGRFAYVGGQPVPRQPGSSQWEIVGRDPSNAPFLRLLQCCFGSQIWFNVRTGGQWSAVGTNNGFMHHVIATGSDARCAPSCDPHDVLLNGRAAPVRRPSVGDAGAASLASCTAPSVPAIGRDSVLAMRNPLFSFLIWNGQDATHDCADVAPARDMAWSFSTRGSFGPLVVNIAGTTSNVSPQTMRFIDTLGLLAVVDGASQGLVLISLDTLSEAHAPYF